MAEQNLDTLTIKVVSDTTDAANGLARLASTLETLKKTTSGGKGFESLKRNIDMIAESASRIDPSGITKLQNLAQSLQAFKDVKDVKISKTIADRLTDIGAAADLIKDVDFSKLPEMSAALVTLSEVKDIKTNKALPSFIVDAGAAADCLKNVDTAKLGELANGLQTLSVVGNIRISKTLPERIVDMGAAVDCLKDVDITKFNELAQGLQTLSSVGNLTMPNVGNSLKSLINPPSAKKSGQDTGISANIDDLSADLDRGRIRLAEFANAARHSLSSIASFARSEFGVFSSFLKKHNVSLRKFGASVASFITAPLRKAQGAIKSFTNKFSNFFAMFKKRAMYRALNGIISAITDGFKTGTDNLYQYSKAISGPFADSMDRIATALLYFKNSIGAAVGPLINMLAPAIDACTDKAVEFINTINQLFARLSGASSWTKAIRYPKEYAEAAEDATKANEELKRTILGFDQLNVLQDNKNKESKKSKTADDYSKMFEEVALTAATSPFADFFTPLKKAWENEGENTIKAIKKAFGQIKELLETVGKTFSEVWQNGTGQETAETILRIVQNIAGAAGNLAESFSKAWKENDSGLRIVQGVWDIFNDILKTIERITGATSNWFKELDLSPLLNSVAGFVEKLEPLIRLIGNIVGDVYENTVLPILTWVIEDLLPTVIDVAGSVTGAFTNFLEPISNGFKDLKKALDPVVTWLQDTVIDILKKVKDHFDEVGKVFEDKKSTIEDAFSDVGDSITTVWNDLEPVLTLLAKALSDIFDLFTAMSTGTIAAFIETLSGLATFIKGIVTPDLSLVWKGLKDIGKGIWDLLLTITAVKDKLIATVIAYGILIVKQLWKTVTEWFGNLWGEFLTKVWDPIKYWLSDVGDWVSDIVVKFIDKLFKFFVDLADDFVALWEGIKKNAKAMWDDTVQMFKDICRDVKDVLDGIKQICKDAWESIKTTATNIWNGLKAFFSNTWNNIKTTATNVWNGIKSFFINTVDNIRTNIANRFEQVKTNIINNFETVRTRLGQIWEGIKNAIRTPANAVIGFIEGMVNGVVNGINKMITALNSLSIDVPDWVPGIGGGKLGFNIQTLQTISIPRLEQGGIVPNTGTMFIAGEAGAEVVANLGNRTGVMNTDEMQRSVEQGILNATGSIANAVAAAVAKAGQNGIAPTVEVTVKADSETLYKTVKKGEKYYNNRYHVVVGV